MSILDIIIVLAMTSGSVITGLLFAFSNFALQSLADLDPKNGSLAMQLINRKIQNPLFLFLFLGSPVLCIAGLVLSIFGGGHGGSSFFIAGSLLYLFGPFGITVRCNVPLNNQLDRMDSDSTAQFWPEYQRRWQFWNHIRTYLGIASVLVFAIGLATS